jgi:hypothetical protein
MYIRTGSRPPSAIRKISVGSRRIFTVAAASMQGATSTDSVGLIKGMQAASKPIVDGRRVPCIWAATDASNSQIKALVGVVVHGTTHWVKIILLLATDPININTGHIEPTPTG